MFPRALVDAVFRKSQNTRGSDVKNTASRDYVRRCRIIYRFTISKVVNGLKRMLNTPVLVYRYPVNRSRPLAHTTDS